MLLLILACARVPGGDPAVPVDLDRDGWDGSVDCDGR
jgi:hypothetical protein